MTPQQRAINRLEESGYLVDVVEQINRVPGRTWRKDLFGAFDLLAIHPAKGDVCAVQVTSRSNVRARVQKLAELPALGALRKAGWRLLVWGYGKTVRSGEWVEVDIS